ncbi:hypothetical protein VP01_278g3 [Puccinia sorghi]|uniref:DDE Tnp4 domain-containing protein n=1 Tax=Puccinia sorghi TaxID=27349 RepID=A0A0L6V2N9_9BASI|nr:hypothetical protein VP01_278g3 [Puccinia sorghi]
MRNITLQPGATPLDSMHKKIYLPFKAFHPIFSNQSQNPQQDFAIQLVVATCCLGSNINGNNYYLASYPESCHDSYVFSNMQISQKTEKLFDQNKFLLAESAYTIRIEHAISILKGQFSSLREFWIVLHNLLADLKDQWNEFYEEYEPCSAPVAEENIDNSNDEIHGILSPITLSHFEEPQLQLPHQLKPSLVPLKTLFHHCLTELLRPEV